MTITEFLEARIAEDEREANVCLASPEHSTRRWKRMLAECAAKRAIVDEYRRVEDAIEADRKDISGTVAKFALGLVMNHLAAVYADHPDYDPEWALS